MTNATHVPLLIFFRNEAEEVSWFLVTLRFLPRRKCHLFPRYLLVRDQTEKMHDAVQSRPPLIIRINDIPWRLGSVCSREHSISRPRIVIPAAVRFQIHWAELPDLRGSLIRSENLRVCSSWLTSNQYLIKVMPASMRSRSHAGHTLRNRSFLVLQDHPTFATAWAPSFRASFPINRIAELTSTA